MYVYIYITIYIYVHTWNSWPERKMFGMSWVVEWFMAPHIWVRIQPCFWHQTGTDMFHLQWSHPHLSISIPTPHLRGFRINVQHLLKQDAILQLPRLRSGWCGTTWTNFTETAVVYSYGATPWNFLVFKWKELGVMMHVPHVNEWVGVDPSRVSLPGFNWHSWILSEFVAPLTKRWKPNLHTKQ